MDSFCKRRSVKQDASQGVDQSIVILIQIDSGADRLDISENCLNIPDAITIDTQDPGPRLQRHSPLRNLLLGLDDVWRDGIPTVSQPYAPRQMQSERGYQYNGGEAPASLSACASAALVGI